LSLSVEIKRLYSPDLPELSDEPDDPLDCWIRVYADIGEVGAPGADTFSLVACTVRAVEREVDRTQTRWGYPLLLVSRFDWSTVTDAIAAKANEVAGTATDWEEFARGLGRFSDWEFEGYQD